MRYVNHPDLETIRKAAVRSLAPEIDAILLCNEWRKASIIGRSILQLQKSRFGFSLFINAGIITGSSYLSGTSDGFILRRLGEFCPELSSKDFEADDG
jgi:hypothetical protein